MSICRICGCRCDPGDLVNGVCDDCRYEQIKAEVRERERQELFARNIKEQADGQLVMIGETA